MKLIIRNIIILLVMVIPCFSNIVRAKTHLLPTSSELLKFRLIGDVKNGNK